jgi:hypothetical protein
MIKSKNVVLKFIIIISIFNCSKNHAAGENIGVEAARVAGEAAVTCVEIITKIILESSPHIGENTARLLAERLAPAFPYLAHKGMQDIAHATAAAAPTIGSEAAKTIADAGYNIATVISGIFIMYKAYDIGKDLYNYMYPSEEAQMRENVAKTVNEAHDAKNNFRECLRKNHTAKRNEFDRPEPCEEYARIFALINEDEMEAMTKTFNKLYRKQ